MRILYVRCAILVGTTVSSLVPIWVRAQVEPGAVAEAASATATQTTVGNAEGDLKFNFSGEEWLGVLQWFADAAGANLDWQELPEGTFNLSTQRGYTVTEVHDVLNLHLLARGFTLLRRGDVLFVVKLDDSLNP